MDIVKMAQQILDMHYELNDLRAENARLRVYEDMYHEEVRAGIKHGEKIMVGLLDICMTPGVIDACRKRLAPNYCCAAKNDIAPPPNPPLKPHHNAE